ncbi:MULTISPECIES: HAD family hydrolase [unclassified Nonomuraea]
MLLRELRRRGCLTAVVSASRHGRAVVTSAGLMHLFDVVVDGEDLARFALPGKPDPAMFLRAAKLLHVPAAQAAAPRAAGARPRPPVPAEEPLFNPAG